MLKCLQVRMRILRNSQLMDLEILNSAELNVFNKKTNGTELFICFERWASLGHACRLSKEF